MPFQRFHGGRLPRKFNARIPALSDFLDKAVTWPPVPAAGWEAAVNPADWGLLGNDNYGDCAQAGILHLIQAQSANAGTSLSATTSQALLLYSAITGFNPNDPSTDQGTVLTDLLTYIQKNGVEMTDSTGKAAIVEVVGSAALDITSIAQMRYATYIFGGSYLGINCPEQCEQDLANWNFPAGLSIAGGHCIPRVGEGAAGGQIVSWGQTIPFSNDFWTAYGDEGYVVITKAWLNAQGQSPSGMDLDGLVAAMNQISAA